MSKQKRIDTRFLTNEAAKKFDEEDKPVFEKAYSMILDNVADPKNLPYVPTMYIFPYLLIKEIPISKHRKVRLTYFAMESVDPSVLTKLAIFAPVYIKRLPFECIVSAMAHELAHFIQKRGRVDAALKYLVTRKTRGFLSMRKAKEKDARSAYDMFKEPVKKWLLQWDKKVARGEYKEEVRAGAQCMKHDDFLKYILGDKYENFIKEEVKKLKLALKS